MSIISEENKKEKVTISKIKNSKKQKKLTVITAYDALFSKLFAPSVDMILVGDSLNMSFAGQKDTLSATLKQMIYHCKAVCNGAKDSFIICDMPFGTYNNKKDALKNANKVYQSTNVQAVKIEGGKSKAKIIKHLTSNSIAVMGHIGLMPQFVRAHGGYIVRGKNEEDIKTLVEDAKAVEEAGAFCLVVEGVRSEAAKEITEAVNIPVIGIGAGKHTDGQVLVWSDMLGFFDEFKPKFVRKYLDGASIVRNEVENYCNDVKDGSFPSRDEEY